MRDRWYCDNRDLVKWGVLTHIAKKYKLYNILQIPYWRPENKYPHFRFQNEQPQQISNDVWKFFRKIQNIKSLGPTLGISINTLTAEFIPGQRDNYVREIKNEIGLMKHPFLLFLDPDTGLQPKTCKAEHTSIDEIESLWRILQSHDWLVLYQHARHTREWVQSVTDQMTCLCSNQKIYVARSEDVGKDVAFFCVQKQ